ncbi:MAG: hypothetical protein B7Y30_06000 [Campylobacterales bacterium 16-40-21]|nr:MAG: hypothetical protein B7Y30_06000 [Campylobacterales bacterium 16-40-21]
MNSIDYYIEDIQACIQKFCINIDPSELTNTHHDLYTDAITEHKKLFIDLMFCTSEDEINFKTEAMISYAIDHNILYMFIYGELITLARSLLGKLIEENNCDDLTLINRHFVAHEERIATLYLSKYLEQMHHKYDLRISHVLQLEDKKLMIHYEDHLQWMKRLITYVEHSKDANYPELCHTNCEFGKWLHSTTLSYLITTSHYKIIENLHVNLHDLAANVVKYAQKQDLQSATLIHFIQRIDYTSLEIGNEIAILSEIEVSSKDSLTDLLSRRLFDTYGHLAGDNVLKDFANLLRETFRQSDYLFRFGGEEFLILLPSTSEDAGYALANNLCEATRLREVNSEGTIIHYTLSAGVLFIPYDSSLEINENLLKSYLNKVDGKMYLAKKNGRNRIE